MFISVNLFKYFNLQCFINITGDLYFIIKQNNKDYPPLFLFDSDSEFQDFSLILFNIHIINIETYPKFTIFRILGLDQPLFKFVKYNEKFQLLNYITM